MFEQPIRILITSHKDVDVLQAPPSTHPGRTRSEDQSLYVYAPMTMRAIPLPRTPCTVRWLHSIGHGRTSPMLAMLALAIIVATLILYRYGLSRKSVWWGYGWLHWWRCHQGIWSWWSTMPSALKAMTLHTGRRIFAYSPEALTHLLRKFMLPAAASKDMDTYGCAYYWASPRVCRGRKRFLNGHQQFANMYIMRKELFDRYAAWVFPLCWRVTARTDMSTYSKEAPNSRSSDWCLFYLAYACFVQRAKLEGKRASAFTLPIQEPRQKFIPSLKRSLIGKLERCSCCLCSRQQLRSHSYLCYVGSMFENVDPNSTTQLSSTPILAAQSRSWLRSTSHYKNARITFYNVWRMVKDWCFWH